MINWGIIGIGNIAGRFAQSLSNEPRSKLIAVSSRSQQKADEFAKKFNVEKTYVGHDSLLADDEVDAIYIALPHALHHDYAIRAIKSGKAVLCEKPATLNPAQMLEIIDTARREEVLFMEAMKTRFVPLYQELKDILNDNLIGQITGVETSLCNLMNLSGETYHTQQGQGGVLLDTGIYCASWLQDLLGNSMTVTNVNSDIRDGIDYYINAELDFNGKSARLECAFDRTKPRQAIIHGELGDIIIDELHRPQLMKIIQPNTAPLEIEVPYVIDDFYGEITHFVDCLERGKIESYIMPLDDSLHCAEILENIRNNIQR